MDIASRRACCGRLADELPIARVSVPITKSLVTFLCDPYLKHRPRPQLTMVDRATDWTSNDFAVWSSGIGCAFFVTIGEADFKQGRFEGLIGETIFSAPRMSLSDPDLSP